MTATSLRTAGLVLSLAYAAVIVRIYVSQPATLPEVTGTLTSTVGAYHVDQARFDAGLAFFHEDKFVEARDAFAQADPARRDPRTQFYVAYTYLRQGWGRLYSDDALYRAGKATLAHARQIAPGLGMARPHQHPALVRLQREDVPGLHDIERARVGTDGGLHGAGAVGRRNAGGHTLGRLDRDGEIGAERRTVGGDHEREIELAAALLGQRQADQPAPVLGHEVDRVGRDELRCHDQIALVFPVFFVDQDDHLASSQICKYVGCRADGRHCMYSACLALAMYG